MNYRMAIMLLGLALIVGAMIPYAYKPRCATDVCTPTAPY